VGRGSRFGCGDDTTPAWHVTPDQPGKEGYAWPWRLDTLDPLGKMMADPGWFLYPRKRSSESGLEMLSLATMTAAAGVAIR